jgi:N-sulfoglucosamine sulfohydrolase
MLRTFALVAAFAGLLASADAFSANDAPPHLVIFISDDHGWLDSSVAEAAEFQTPNLERLAEAGMTLTHAFAASPSCAPSRAALLTGLMPIRNGSMLNHQPPRKDVRKLPAYLQELGYEVVAFGKVAHYHQGKDYGFDLVAHDGFHDERCVAAAVEFLEKRTSDKPLCLFVGTNWPHVPWPETANQDANAFRPPPTHVDTPETRQWRARYAAAVARMDVDLGKIYDAAFERLGQNTLFLHFSDHGAQWPFGKWNLYDAGARVSIFAVWPGVIPPASRTDAMVSLVDVLPTLVDAAGGTPPSDIDGRSFASVLTGTQSEHRERIFATHSGDGRMNAYPIRSVRTPRWKYIRNLRPAGEHSTHIDRGKAIDGNDYWLSWVERVKTDPLAAATVERYHRRPVEELYDLRSDPHEQNNYAGDARHANTLEQLRSAVGEWMRDNGDEGLKTEGAVTEEFLRRTTPTNEAPEHPSARSQ